MNRRRSAKIAGLLLTGGVLAVVLWPLPTELLTPLPQKTLTITDRSGELLYRQGPEGSGKAEPVLLNNVPLEFISTLLTTEDRTFYEHAGLSLRGIVRAFVRNIQAGSIEEGGSTLTQQYVRLRLGRNRSVLGKLRDMLFALKLERVLSKDEILERYLNTASFGQGGVGLGAASRMFFGKTPKELSLSEDAFLVGLLQSPTSLDPRKNFSGAKKRQELILDTLVTQNVISLEESKVAKDLPVHLHPERIPIRAPHFVFWILSEHPELNGYAPVKTTLDLSLQTDVESIVARELKKLEDKRVTSAAVVVLDAKTGDVLAMVGSADYFNAANDGAVNIAVSARQPGSALKPFTYALALKGGQTAASIVPDIVTQFLTEDGLPYTPRNYDYSTHGPVSIREALGNSLNIAAVRTLEKVGVPNLLHFLQAAGITTLNDPPEHYGLALTLGAGEVRLLELARAYGIFVRAGRTLTLRSLLSEPTSPEGTSVLDPRIAWIITDILSDPTARLAEFGEDNPLVFPYPVAAKTGTTRNSRDNWTIGYTPQRIVGVWVGNADNATMKDTSGITGAGPIFHAVMEAAMEHLAKEEFPKPAGIVQREVCRLSGKVPTDLCPGIRKEFFLAGTEPLELDYTFRRLRVDRSNQLLVSDNCSSQFIDEKTFAFFPLELRPWARDHGWPDPQTQFSPRCMSSSANTESEISLEITQPHDGDRYRISPIIPPDQQAIILKATSGTSETVEWLVDGRKLGNGVGVDHRFSWVAPIGMHMIAARTKGVTKSVTVEVLAENRD